MSWREDIMNRVTSQIEKLLLVDHNGIPMKPSPGSLTTVAANAGFNTPCYAVVQRPVVVSAIEQEKLIPAAYLSFDGGRINPGIETTLNNVVESLGIRVEMLFRDGAGQDDNGKSRPLSLQVGACVSDIHGLINYNTMKLTSFSEENVWIINCNLAEWGFDSRFRGTPDEVLIMIFQLDVSHPQV